MPAASRASAVEARSPDSARPSLTLRRGETVVVDDVNTDPRFTDAERAQLLAAQQIAAFVGMPLIKDGRWLATFGVHSATPRAWTRDQIALVEITADRTWSAAERARAEEALGRSEDRQAFLRALNDTSARSPIPRASSRRPAACSARTCASTASPTARSTATTASSSTITWTACPRWPAASAGAIWPAVARRHPERPDAVVDDTSTDPHTAGEREALQAAGIGAYICPLLIKDGRFVAAFGIHSRAPRVWTPDEIALVQEVADRIWATLEHRKAEAELRANEERLAFLLRLNDALRPLSDPRRRAGNRRTASRRAPRRGPRRLRGTRRPRVHHSPRIRPRRRAARRPAGRNRHVGPRCARPSGAARPSSSTTSTPIRGSATTSGATLRARQIAAFVGVTLFKDGQMVAAFGANHATPRVWTPAEIELVRDVAERTWDAVERTRAEAALREQNSGSASRSKRRPAAPGRGTPQPIRSTGTTASARSTASRPTNRATPDAWMPACTTTTARGCSASSTRS